MRLGPYYLDFEHYPELKSSRAFLYDSDAETDEPIDWVEVACYYTDRFSRKGGRRACMRKLLDPHQGKFAGPENRRLRAYLWGCYWAAQPNDVRVSN